VLKCASWDSSAAELCFAHMRVQMRAQHGAQSASKQLGDTKQALLGAVLTASALVDMFTVA
jgi:hypothetical protein